jgi:hypothetical protein
MEQIVPDIFAALGGSTVIARGISTPVQTVNDWLKKGAPEIPPWRRGDVLSFARSSGKLTELSAGCLAYLQSQERTVGSQAKAA